MEELRKENQQRLWNSLEMGDVKRNIVTFLVMMPIMWAIAVARVRQPEAQTLMLLLMAALVLPYLVFYVVRMVRILLHAEKYVFCQTKLTKPHNSLNHRLYYFSVVLKDGQGKEFMADTHAIFANRNLFGPQLEDYVNQTVTVAHNPVTGMVVVIG